MTDRPTEPRLEPLSADELDDDQRAVLEPLGTFRGQPMNIFTTLGRHPKLLKRWLVFGTHVLMKSTLPARERELLILRTAWNCHAEYEFGHHAEIGVEAGLTAEEVRATTLDIADADWSEDDAILIRAADELHGDSCLSDGTWAALTDSYGEQQIIDMIFAVGQYHTVSMALNSLGIQLEEGLSGFPD